MVRRKPGHKPGFNPSYDVMAPSNGMPVLAGFVLRTLDPLEAVLEAAWWDHFKSRTGGTVELHDRIEVTAGPDDAPTHALLVVTRSAGDGVAVAPLVVYDTPKPTSKPKPES